MNEGVSSPQGHSGRVESQAVKTGVTVLAQRQACAAGPSEDGGSRVLREGGRWAEKGEGPCQEADSPGQGASAVQVGVKAFRQLWIKQRVLRGQRWEGSRPAVGKLGVRSRNLRFETFRNIFRMRSCWLSTIIVFDQVFKNVLIFNRLHRFRIEVF